MINYRRNYTATLVLDTRESEESADAMISKLSEIIAHLDGEVKKVENLGSREIARPKARNFSSAVYVKIDFESGREVPSKIKEQLRLEKTIDRIIIEIA
tara:strand:- start:179 stop:475 length:297 start_codon:yes stop_codon:yes gene_type:complete